MEGNGGPGFEIFAKWVLINLQQVREVTQRIGISTLAMTSENQVESVKHCKSPYHSPAALLAWVAAAAALGSAPPKAVSILGPRCKL